MTVGGGARVCPPQRACFFGTYASNYTVTRLLLQACRAAGVEVVECHQPLWEHTRHKTARYFGARSLTRLAVRYLRVATALSARRRALGPLPLYVVGFNGQVDCLLLRLLARRDPKPIVFAPLVTLSETLVEDRALFGAHTVRAWGARLIDRASLSVAAHVIIDTEAHRQYLIDTFGVKAGCVSAWHLGADPDVFAPVPPAPDTGPIRVLFHGTFLPLHGVRYILEAAHLLRAERDIAFVLVGGGPQHDALVAYARAADLHQVTFADWIDYENLGPSFARADICLGIFGTGRKAHMVIPNKVYQAAAVGRPIVTADTPAVREVFTHGQTAWLCPAGDAAALAAAIRTLARDAALRQRLSAGAAALMCERFSPAKQGQRLAAIFATAMTSA